MEIGVLISWLVLAGLVAVWAANKGRNAGLAFLASIVLSPLVGFIIVAILKDKRAIAEARADVATETRERRACPHCAESIKRAAKVCRYCQREVSPLPSLPEPAPSAVSRQRFSIGAVEVLVAVALIIVAVIGGVSQIGTSANNTFTTVASQMN